MGQVITADNIPDLVIASTTTITMASSYLGKPTRITIGGQQYKYSSLTTLNFGTTGFNGLDTGSIASNTLYYIYAVQSSGTPGLVASLAAPTVGPTGFTRWKEIGRCRTLSTAATLAAIVNRDGLLVRGGASREYETTTSYSITAVTSNPVLGTNTVLRHTAIDGEWAIIRFEVGQTVAGTGGTGDYLFPLPSLVTINYQKTTSGFARNNVGHGLLLVNSTYFRIAAWVLNSGSYVNKISCFLMNDTTTETNWTGGGNGNFGNGTVNGAFTVRVAVNEWQGLYT